MNYTKEFFWNAHCAFQDIDQLSPNDFVFVLEVQISLYYRNLSYNYSMVEKYETIRASSNRDGCAYLVPPEGCPSHTRRPTSCVNNHRYFESTFQLQLPLQIASDLGGECFSGDDSHCSRLQGRQQWARWVSTKQGGRSNGVYSG